VPPLPLKRFILEVSLSHGDPTSPAAIASATARAVGLFAKRGLLFRKFSRSDKRSNPFAYPEVVELGDGGGGVCPELCRGVEAPVDGGGGSDAPDLLRGGTGTGKGFKEASLVNGP